MNNVIKFLWASDESMHNACGKIALMHIIIWRKTLTKYKKKKYFLNTVKRRANGIFENNTYVQYVTDYGTVHRFK